MNYQEIDQDDIKKIETAMKDYDAYDGWTIEDDGGHVVWTTETTDDFKASMVSGLISRNEVDFNGIKADKIRGWQPKTGESRKDILIFDMGDHRIVIGN